MSYTLIQTVTLTSNQASISFNSIPATFDDLALKISARSTNSSNIRLNINGQGAGVNLTNRGLFGTGSQALSVVNTQGEGGFATEPAMTSNTFGVTDLYLPNYRSSTNKSYSFDSAQETNATAAVQIIVAGLWSQTAVITSLAFTLFAGDFVSGSSISLYGITRGSSGGVVVS